MNLDPINFNNLICRCNSVQQKRDDEKKIAIIPAHASYRSDLAAFVPHPGVPRPARLRPVREDNDDDDLDDEGRKRERGNKTA